MNNKKPPERHCSATFIQMVTNWGLIPDLKVTTILTVYKIKIAHESAAREWSQSRFLADRVACFWWLFFWVRGWSFLFGVGSFSKELAVPKRVSNLNQSITWHHHMKGHVELGHLTKYDALRVNRDQVMDLEIRFKIHTNVVNFETASPKII